MTMADIICLTCRDQYYISTYTFGYLNFLAAILADEMRRLASVATEVFPLSCFKLSKKAFDPDLNFSLSEIRV